MSFPRRRESRVGDHGQVSICLSAAWTLLAQMDKRWLVISLKVKTSEATAQRPKRTPRGAGIQGQNQAWTPACAGVTEGRMSFPRRPKVPARRDAQGGQK